MTNSSEFTSRKPSIWLRLDDSVDGSPGPTLGAVSVTTTVGRRVVQKGVLTHKLPGNEELIKVGVGTYTLNVAPITVLSPAASVSFALAGDANGTYAVNRASLRTIRSLLGVRSGSMNYNPAADVTNDGVINAADLKWARLNLSASTKIRPLAISVATTTTPLSIPLVDRTVTVSSSPGVQVLATDTNEPATGVTPGTQTSGITTKSGTFSFNTAVLSNSYDEFNLNIQANDSFGQYVNVNATIPNAIGEAYGQQFATEPPYDPSLAPNDPTPESGLPSSVDLSTIYNLPIYNQGTYNSCVANAFSLDYVYIEKVEGLQNPIDPSRLFIYYNARAAEPQRPITDMGTQDAAAVTTMVDTGVAPSSAWPYSSPVNAAPSPTAYAAALSHRVTKFYQLNNTDIQQIELSLANGYPVILSFRVYPSFDTAETRQTGVIPMPSPNEKPDGGHAVLLVGYNNTTGQFKFANSWGSSWGDHGYGYLPFAYCELFGNGLYSIRQET